MVSSRFHQHPTKKGMAMKTQNPELVAARDALKRAADEHESKLDRLDQWAEKLDSLEPEVEALKVEIDPLDAKAVNHLLVVDLQVQLLREKLDSPAPALGPLVAAISKAHEQFQLVTGPLLEAFKHRRSTSIIATLALPHGAGMVADGYLQHDLQWLNALEFASGRSFRVENSVASARRGIDAIDQLLAGTSPLTSAPATTTNEVGKRKVAA
jgi:hypothetical protein